MSRKVMPHRQMPAGALPIALLNRLFWDMKAGLADRHGREGAAPRARMMP